MDTSLLHALNAFAVHHDGVEDPLSLYERLAEPLFALALLALALAGRRFAWSLRAALAAGASTAVALVIAQIVARTVDRPRPFVAHPAAVHLFVAHARDPGFPSDHATAAFAIGATIALYRRGPGLAVLAAALVLAVGRVALGVHYPSDVLAGAILGSAVAVGLHRLRPVRARLDALADAVAARLPAPGAPRTS